MYYLGVLDGIDKQTLHDRMDRLLDLTNLLHAKRKKVRALSGGMKRRLGIAQCLLNDPPIFVVDEPTAGLDPEERIRFRNLLSDLAEDKTVLLSTHIASDIESSSSHIGILENGAILYQGEVKDLLHTAKEVSYETDLPRHELAAFKKRYLVYEQKDTAQGLRLRFLCYSQPEKDFRAVAPSLEAAYLNVLHSDQRKP